MEFTVTKNDSNNWTVFEGSNHVGEIYLSFGKYSYYSTVNKDLFGILISQSKAIEKLFELWIFK